MTTTTHQTTHQELMSVAPSVAPAEYTTAQVELIKKTVAVGCSTDELALFLEVCRGSGLNPFMRQIYAIKRGDKMTVQTGIDGYRLLAARTGALAGIDDAVYDDERGERPGWASVTVWRFVQGQRVGFTAKARWSEYAQVNRDGNPTGLWGRMPFLMLAKCAEALALRKAFPAELSGFYTAEEMDQADNPPMAYIEAPQQAPQQTSQQAPVVDRFSAPLRDKATLDLLIRLQRFTDADRRAELASAFAAIEAAGQRVTNRTLAAELQARIDEVTALAADPADTGDTADLSTLATGSIGA